VIAISAPGLQFRDDIRDDLVDIACAQDEDEVAGRENVPQERADALRVGLEPDLLVSELTDLLVEGLPGDAGDGVLAGGVDFR
jgi:hypothetical protein